MNKYEIETKNGLIETTKKGILGIESFAYYSGLNGLELKGIEYGINDYVFLVSGALGGKKRTHRLKVYYTIESAYIKLDGYRVPLDECIRTEV